MDSLFPPRIVILKLSSGSNGQGWPREQSQNLRNKTVETNMPLKRRPGSRTKKPPHRQQTAAAQGATVEATARMFTFIATERYMVTNRSLLNRQNPENFILGKLFDTAFSTQPAIG